MRKLWQRYMQEDDAGGGAGPGGGDPGEPGGDPGEPGGMMSSAGGWELAPGVAGEGDRPEWFSSKYKTILDQAQAYPELRSKMGEYGTFFGAPESDYELTLPEGITGEYDNDNPMLKAFTETAKEVGLSQEGFNKLLHAYVGADAGLVETHEMRVANVAHELGENGETIIADTWQRLSQLLPENEAKALDGLVGSADAIRGLQKLIAAEAILPNTDTQHVGAMSREELRAMRGEVYPEGHVKAGKRMYGDDKAHTEKVDALYKQHFPGDDVQIVNPTAA